MFTEEKPCCFTRNGICIHTGCLDQCDVLIMSELITLKGTKAILFPMSQDANLFWLVIVL